MYGFFGGLNKYTGKAMRYFIFIITLLSLSFASSFASHKIESMPKSDGELGYQKHCAECHHKNKIGFVGPPLLAENLRKYSDEKLLTMIKNGFPNTLMPKYEHLSHEELGAIIDFMRKPILKPVWNRENIVNSKVTFSDKRQNLNIKNIRNITPVVERGINSVWILEDDKILSKFDVKNVHGGIKYIMDASAVFVPSRDGKITKISLKDGRLESEIRACVSMRNISVSKDGKSVIATCLLPKNIVVLSSDSLAVKKIIDVNGTISSLYDLYSKDKAIFTLRDKPLLGIMDTTNFSIEYSTLKEPFEDFFIDPFEKFIIGSARGGKLLSVYDMENKNYAFEYPIEGMPHLFSATYWYKDGKFYFASPHLGKNYISIWQMYDWKLVKRVDIGGSGFFAKTHPYTPYLFADNGTDELSLIDKKDFKVVKIKPKEGKKFNHTEFSGDGKFSYLSIYEKDGEVKVWDTSLLREIVSYPANTPVGKYNFVNKNRVFYKEMFGEEIFKEKCWGCHHQSAEAFAPSFAKIADNRDEALIKAHIIDPKSTSKILGYKRSSMPPFNLNEYELDSIAAYIKSFK